MYEKYVDVSRSNYLDPDKYPLEFEEFYKSIDWTPYELGEEVALRDPYFLLSECNSGSNFMKCLKIRHGKEICHPGVIASNLEELDYWAKVEKLPKSPGDVCKIGKVISLGKQYMLLINEKVYYYYSHFWLTRSGSTITRSCNSKCFLCGSPSEILFNVCRCNHHGCPNNR